MCIIFFIVLLPITLSYVPPTPADPFCSHLVELMFSSLLFNDPMSYIRAVARSTDNFPVSTTEGNASLSPSIH